MTGLGHLSYSVHRKVQLLCWKGCFGDSDVALVISVIQTGSIMNNIVFAVRVSIPTEHFCPHLKF
jgi:hypothetical protein